MIAKTLPKPVLHPSTQQFLEYKSVQFKTLRNTLKKQFNVVTGCREYSFNSEDTLRKGSTN